MLTVGCITLRFIMSSYVTDGRRMEALDIISSIRYDPFLPTDENVHSKMESIILKQVFFDSLYSLISHYQKNSLR